MSHMIHYKCYYKPTGNNRGRPKKGVVVTPHASTKSSIEWVKRKREVKDREYLLKCSKYQNDYYHQKKPNTTRAYQKKILVEKI